MSKIELDKYYTPKSVVEKCVDVLGSIIGVSGVTDVIEPSAGDGAFIESVENTFHCGKSYLDIAPESSLVKEQDFLTYNEVYKKGRVIIGNPPFGSRNSLIIKFFKKSVELGDYVAFILPISQLNNTKQLYEFDLIYSEDLGVENYSGVPLHCCFNVYKRPNNGVLNKKPKTPVINGLDVVEYRRDKEDSYRKKVKEGYFHSIGSWGNGCVGVTPEYIGKFAMELYFYSEVNVIRHVVQSIDWRQEVKSISGKKLPKGLALEIIKNKLEVGL